ncbi:hypothetical protein ACHAW5_001499 [Stephanodiscus triporus]|uniref:Uncharacterized protein n=1 Tax=Stephanodiscus triporus TaxID=2934178 RepID=A0ABD3NML3_9STRA
MGGAGERGRARRTKIIIGIGSRSDHIFPRRSKLVTREEHNNIIPRVAGLLLRRVPPPLTTPIISPRAAGRRNTSSGRAARGRGLGISSKCPSRPYRRFTPRGGGGGGWGGGSIFDAPSSVAMCAEGPGSSRPFEEGTRGDKEAAWIPHHGTIIFSFGG